MSDQTPVGDDAGTPAPEGTPEGAPSGDDYQARIDQRLEEMSKSQQQALKDFEDRFSERFLPQDDPEDEPEDLDPDDPDYDEKAFEQFLKERIDQGVQERLTPIQQQQQLQERNRRYGDLQSKYPELQDSSKAEPIVEAIASWAVENIGEDFLETPAFVDLIEREYKAYVADQRAAQETPAGEREEVQLESGGGAAPADREEDIQDRILKAAESASPRI